MGLPPTEKIAKGEILVDILELLPQYILYIFFAIIAVIVALIVLSVWSNIAPAAPGVVLGYLEIIGTYAGGKLFKRFEGTVVDASNIFLNTQYEDEFKESLLADLKLLKEKNPAILELEKVKDEFEKCHLNEMCRILVTRERLFDKHIFVQWGCLGALNEYAAKEEKPKFTLSNLFVSRGAVRGQLHSFPTRWEIEGVGTCQVHLFKPDTTEATSKNEKLVEPPTFLAKVALNIPAVVEFKGQLKSWQEKYRDLRREYLKVLSATSTVATERDFYRSLSSKIGTEPVLTPAPTPSPPKRWDWKDIALVGIPGLLSYVTFAQYYIEYNPLIGALVGLGIGLFLAWWRRRSE